MPIVLACCKIKGATRITWYYAGACGCIDKSFDNGVLKRKQHNIVNRYCAVCKFLYDGKVQSLIICRNSYRNRQMSIMSYVLPLICNYRFSIRYIFAGEW